MSFTRAQQKYYRPLVEKAWAAHCERSGEAINSRFQKDQWYRCTLLDTVGVYSTKEADKTIDFDALMLAFAQIAGDSYWINRMAEAEERRWHWLIHRKLSQMKISSATTKEGKTYLDGIMHRMGIAQQPLNNLPADHLKKLYIALDKQSKRHQKAEVSHASL